VRIAFIGIQHWHARHYYRTVAKLPGHTICGISEPDAGVLQRVGAELGAPAYADYREMIEACTPEFVFIFGLHHELAETARFVIEHGIACLVEKPAGLNEAQVAGLRDSALARGLHVGTGFNFRVSDFYKHVMSAIEDDPVTWASLRFIAGTPDRYHKSGNAWMLDPTKSGGGCTINLSVHLFDMFRQFTRSDPAEVASLMGNHSWQLPVEDYSSVSLRSPRAVCTVETGYTFPDGGTTPFDVCFCVRTRRDYIVLRGDGVIECHHNANGEVSRISTASAGNAYWYPAFVQESLERFERGLPPVADLADLASAMRIVDAAYRSSRHGGAVQSLDVL
jgi:predicted dehydrogenase